MTDDNFFPPLVTLPRVELQAHKQHLLAEIAHQPERRRFSSSSVRARLALTVTSAICIAAAAAAIAVWPSGSTPITQPGGSGADPVHSLPPASISLSDAAAVLGAPVVLPNTSLVNPADTTNVDKTCAAIKLGNPLLPENCLAWRVGVYFPDQGVSIRYMPVAYGDPPSTFVNPPNGRAIQLGDIPAMLVPEVANDPDTATDIEFNLDGLTIIVTGHYDPATLEPVAQSIIDQMRSAEQ